MIFTPLDALKDLKIVIEGTYGAKSLFEYFNFQASCSSPHTTT
jgi:hypothetical protein